MAASSRKRTHRPSPWARIFLWAIPIAFVGLIVAFFFVKSAIDSYLRSDAFRKFIGEKAGETLHAEADLQPLSFNGSSIFAEGFQAKGGPNAAFANLQIEQIRTELSFRRFFEKVWQVEQFDVQRVRLDLDGPRAELPEKPTANPIASNQGASGGAFGWLPNRVEIGHAAVHDTQLNWKGGGLTGTAFEIEPFEGGWKIAGHDGRITYDKLPPMDVSALQLRYRAPSLFVNRAELRQPSGGSLVASGEIDFTRQLDLQLNLTNVNISPYLSADWRLRASGNLSGEVTVRSSLPAQGGPQIAGSVRISQGELTALPVLDQLAFYTHTQQFRRLNLSNVSGDFTRDDRRLRVTNFIAESNGLIRLEGAFVIEQDKIDGSFQVGVSPSTLQWLPGSQTKVFTDTHGGYAWTSMRLTGLANKPTEDLTPRLIAALEGAVVEGAQNAAGEAIKTGKDVIKGALDLVLPGTK